MPENHSGDTVLGFLFATAVLVARLHSLEVDGSGPDSRRLGYGVGGPTGEFDTNAVLYSVWQYAGRCTDAARVDLVVFVAMLVVLTVSMGLPWVT